MWLEQLQNAVKPRLQPHPAHWLGVVPLELEVELEDSFKQILPAWQEVVYEGAAILLMFAISFLF